MDQLTTQKQLASKYSDRVSELERESRLRGLELKEAKKELETEKSLASKLYDDVSNKHAYCTSRKCGEGWGSCLECRTPPTH